MAHRRAGRAWLAALALCAALAAWPAAASAPGPLAVALDGMAYPLEPGAAAVQLSLACPGRAQVGLALQQPSPPRAAGQCRARLEVLEQGAGTAPVAQWLGQQAHAAELSLAGQPGASAAPWWAFTVQQPAAVFQQGRIYTLRLELACAGSGSSSSSSVAVRAVCSTVDLPGRHAGGGSIGRQLTQASTAIFDTPSPPLPPVPVTLAPLSGAGAEGGSQTVVVDGYSGLARAINASSAAPVCGSAAAASASRCLRNPMLRTAASQIVLVLTLGSGGTFASGNSIGPAISLSGGNATVASTRRTTSQTAEITIRLLSDQPVTTWVAEGALKPYLALGASNTASNVVSVERDSEAPRPVISTPGNQRVTDSRQISFSIEFGEPVLATDPYQLFSFAGVRRLDAVLDVAAGRVDIAAYILDEDAGEEADVGVWVKEGTVRDVVGNANTVRPSLTVKYRPSSSGLQAGAVVANVFFASSLALCTAASYVHSALLPFSHGVLGCGALGFVGWAQSLYLTGQLSAAWMPESYRQVADTFSWTVGDIGLSWADSTPDMNPSYAFPFVPVVLTSTGQEVAAAQYPALSSADVGGGGPLVAVTGELSELGGGAVGLSAVLPGIKFLDPNEAQQVGAPPQPPPQPEDTLTIQEAEASPSPDPSPTEAQSMDLSPPPPEEPQDSPQPPSPQASPSPEPSSSPPVEPPAASPPAGAPSPQPQPEVSPSPQPQPSPSPSPQPSPPPSPAASPPVTSPSPAVEPPAPAPSGGDGTGGNGTGESPAPAPSPEASESPAPTPSPTPEAPEPAPESPPPPSPSPPPPSPPEEPVESPQPVESPSPSPEPQSPPADASSDAPAPAATAPAPSATAPAARPPDTSPADPPADEAPAPVPSEAPSSPPPRSPPRKRSPPKPPPEDAPSPPPSLDDLTLPALSPNQAPAAAPLSEEPTSPSPSRKGSPSPSPSDFVASPPEREAPPASPSPSPSDEEPAPAPRPEPSRRTASARSAAQKKLIDSTATPAAVAAELEADAPSPSPPPPRQRRTPGSGNVSAASLSPSPSPSPEANSGGSGNNGGSGGGDAQEQPAGGDGGRSPSPSPPADSTDPQGGGGAAAAAAAGAGGGGGSGSNGGGGGDNGGGGGSNQPPPEPQPAEQSPPTPEQGSGTVVDTGDIPSGSLTSLDAARRRLAAVSAARSNRRALLQAGSAAASAQPAFDGTLYIVASRGLELMSPGGTPDLNDVLVSGGAVQRAYDVIDAAGEDGAYPRQYYYDRLARTAFWTALFAFVVMAGHLACLGIMMWRNKQVPDVMWFPRIELAVCLAILPALAFGAAGLFQCSPGDIVLGAFLLLLLPCSFLGAGFLLLYRWLQHPQLNRRRAIFVLQRDPLAAAIAAPTPEATPRGRSMAALAATGTNGAANDAAGTSAAAEGAAAEGAADGAAGGSEDAAATAAAALALNSRRMAEAQARRWTFVGFTHSLFGARKLPGDWCGINLDSRFVHKYGPLFEATYGQAMVRRRATFEFDPVRGKVDRGTLVCLPELPTISWRRKPLLQPHHLRSPAQLVAAVKMVILAAGISAVHPGADSYIQCCLLILLYGFYTIYLWAVRPYSVALVGGFELASALTTLTTCGLAMAVMDGRGSSDLTRSTVGAVMLSIQLVAFLCYVGGTWLTSMRALWAATGLRARLRLPPSPGDKFADTVLQVMGRDPHILARKFADRWMVRALGVGLYDRPVWRRETEDLRRLLKATVLPRRRVANMGSVVRRKTLSGPEDEAAALPGGPLPPVAVAPPPGSVAGTSTAGGSITPRSASGVQFTPGNTPGAPNSLGGGLSPAFNSLVSDFPGSEGGGTPSGDAVIAVPQARRSPPREVTAEPGSELHRQLSDPAMLAQHAQQAQQAQQQQQQQPNGQE